MPDKRTHRGPNPADQKIFSPSEIKNIRLAVTDYSLLQTKGYAQTSSLKLVGDHFSLTARQRLAVMRTACSDQQLAQRTKTRLDLDNLPEKPQPIAIDTYNLLITIEAALSGAPVFISRDKTFKDLAGLHGTYRKVTETLPALQLITDFLKEKNLAPVKWYIDSPVSNSGRLKTIMAELAEKNNVTWSIDLVHNPDTELFKTPLPVVSSDGIILDRCKNWINLAADIITQKIPSAWLIDLSTY